VAASNAQHLGMVLLHTFTPLPLPPTVISTEAEKSPFLFFVTPACAGVQKPPKGHPKMSRPAPICSKLVLDQQAVKARKGETE